MYFISCSGTVVIWVFFGLFAVLLSHWSEIKNVIGRSWNCEKPQLNSIRTPPNSSSDWLDLWICTQSS